MSNVKPRVLVIDHRCERVIDLLRQAGCQQVRTASSGIEALKILKQENIDILICNPRMSAIDILDFLHDVALTSNVKALIFMGELAPDIRRSFRQLSAMMGLQVLAELDKRLDAQALKRLFEHYINTRFAPPPRLTVDQQPTRQAVYHALSEEQFDAYFQPRFNLSNGQVHCVEVRARWNHPTLGIIAPSTFLPMLDCMELRDSLLTTLLQQSLKLQKKALKQGCPLNVSLRVEGAQLSQRSFPHRVKALLAEHDVPGCNLTLELSERNALHLSVATLENLIRLRMLGCRLAIDDFGSSYSSLMRLCHMPFNEIKLDKTFVQNLPDDSHCGAAIASTLTLGNSLGMLVICKGVETEAQRQALVTLGATIGLGDFAAKPMPATELLHWLERQSSSKADCPCIAGRYRNEPAGEQSPTCAYCTCMK